MSVFIGIIILYILLFVVVPAVFRNFCEDRAKQSRDLDNIRRRNHAA